ncbi:hypothetical protein [Lacipirellula sp.]
MSLYVVKVGQYLLPIQAVSPERALMIAKFYAPQSGEPAIVA